MPGRRGAAAGTERGRRIGSGRRQDTGQAALLYGTRTRVGATDGSELERLAGEDDRVGEVYRKLRDIRDGYADDVRARFPKHLPRRVSGYDLDELLPEMVFHVARALSGTEGTYVTVLAAKLRLIPTRARTLVVLGHQDLIAASRLIPRMLEYDPIGLEVVDERLVRSMRLKRLPVDELSLLPDGGSYFLVEFGAATALLGTAFLGVKAWEYHDHASRLLLPGSLLALEHPELPPETGLFLSFSWVVTGAHALHLLIGVLVVAAMVVRPGLRGGHPMRPPPRSRGSTGTSWTSCGSGSCRCSISSRCDCAAPPDPARLGTIPRWLHDRPGGRGSAKGCNFCTPPRPTPEERPRCCRQRAPGRHVACTFPDVPSNERH